MRGSDIKIRGLKKAASSKVFFHSFFLMDSELRPHLVSRMRRANDYFELVSHGWWWRSCVWNNTRTWRSAWYPNDRGRRESNQEGFSLQASGNNLTFIPQEWTKERRGWYGIISHHIYGWSDIWSIFEVGMVGFWICIGAPPGLVYLSCRSRWPTRDGHLRRSTAHACNRSQFQIP